MDYNFPILHLENWFNTDEVTLNCQKRKEVQSIILEMVAEQGLALPPGVTLPNIRFTALKSTHNSQHNSNTSNSPHNTHSIQQHGYQNQSQHYYRNLDEMDDDDEEEECEEEDNVGYFEDEDPVEYQSNIEYSDDYNNMVDEYQELHEISDQREYYVEMGEGNGEWSEGQHDINEEDYQSE